MAGFLNTCVKFSMRSIAVSTAVVAIAIGMWLQELEIFRQNSPGAEWVNWIGDYSCGQGVIIERPKTVESLKEAVTKHASVRAGATGHSFNPFVCPSSSSGAVVDMIAFRDVEVRKLSDGSYAVSAGAGIKMGQLQNSILSKGLTLRVPPGNSAYTLGGCLATGCHNLGQSHAQDLIDITFMLHNGSIQTARRGESDFDAAAVSLGRLGIILSATLEVLPFRSLTWASEQFPIPSIDDIFGRLKSMSAKQTSQETVGNKLVFYLNTDVMMVEHWVPTGRSSTPDESAEPLGPYVNPQPFRVGQGMFTRLLDIGRRIGFGAIPQQVLNALQIPAETAFRGLHTSAALASVRKVLGWQHSPEARGEGSSKPAPNLYTWAGFMDEIFNLFMGLRHVEVIFPLEPKERATKCLEAVFAHKHLAWWRLNIRTQKSEGFFLSSTHASAADGEDRTVFLRVDFVAPGALMDLPSGEASLTKLLHTDCPGWRKHWGKGLFATASEERWGNPEAFLEVAKRWDPAGKFQPRMMPAWLASP